MTLPISKILPFNAELSFQKFPPSIFLYTTNTHTNDTRLVSSFTEADRQ